MRIYTALLAASALVTNPAYSQDTATSACLHGSIKMSVSAHSVGVVTMLSDHTICVWLKPFKGPEDDTARPMLVAYPPDRPSHPAVLREIGQLKPGQSKPIAVYLKTSP